MLPPVIFAAEVIVDVAEINPPVKILPPVMLAVTETTAPRWLVPVTVPVADIRPLVSKLPLVTLPVVLTGFDPRAARLATTFELP